MNIVTKLKELGVEITDDISKAFQGEFVSKAEMDKKVQKAETERDDWKLNDAPFLERHNLPHMHPHKFRHSQASILYASGIDVVTISKRLGHQQVSTTQDIYAHMMKESDKKASEAIAKALYRNEA